MAITVQGGVGTFNGSPGTTLTPALPASVVAGDLLLLIVNTQNDIASATSSGYAQIHEDTTGNGDDFWVLTKTAGGSESAPTVTLSASILACALVVRVRDWDSGGGPAQLTANASATTTASIDPPTAGSVKIGIVHIDPSTAGVVAWDGGITDAGSIANTSAAYLSVGYKLEDTPGALTFTWSGTGTPGTLILSIAPTVVIPPVAAFTGTPLTGAAPLNVAFTDTSTNSPTSWAWDFGDSNTSTSQNPSNNYTAAGTYDVELVATNAGGSDTETKVGYVTVGSALEGRVNIAFDSGPLTATPTWTRIDDDESGLVSRIEIHRGRQTEFDHTETSTATVYLNDRWGLFDPTNGSSPYYQNLDGKQISLSLQNPVTLAWVEQYRGIIDSYEYEFAPSQVVARVKIECVGLFDYLAGVEMLPGAFGDDPPTLEGAASTVFYEDTDVQTRITQLLTDAGLPAARFVVFTGNVDVQETHYDPGDSVLVALRDAADAEFPTVANLYEDKQGRVVFHGRYARFDPEGTEASASPGQWTFTRWECGDGTAIGADPTLAQIRPPLQWSRSRRMIRNAALAYPRYPIRGMGGGTFTDADMVGQVSTDPASITDFGYRSWSAPDLITLAGTTTGNNAAEETRLFADHMVANYALPRTRIEAVTFKAIHPSDSRAAATWALICGIDVSDGLTIAHDYPGGGLLFEAFYVEGSDMTISPLNPDFDMVELTVNVSPAAYYTTDVFS